MTCELESLAETEADIVPMSSTDWDAVWEAHGEIFPGLNRTFDFLKRKFQEMARTKIPTGDPNCPHHIRIAKRTYYKLIKASDGSTGAGSDDILDVEVEEEGAGEGGEEGDGGIFSDDDEEDSRAVQEDVGVVIDRPAEDEGGRGTSLGADPTNLFEELRKNNDESVGDVGHRGTYDLLAVASASTSAASASEASARGGTKRRSLSRSASTVKKTRAYTKPLRIPQKSPSNSSDSDGEGDGWSFGNMMHMMMMQGRMDNERREHQHKLDMEQREREYQLRREEMALAREESREQRQMMNLMFMAMLNKNAGSDSNPHPPSPSKP